jgi:serine/threonine protein kinase
MKELEAALQVFKDAWESGQPEGVTEFCDRYPDISDALRERIDDFLYVSAGLDGLGQRARVVDQHSHPDEIGPYEVLDVLGEGGMGIVYLCAQRAFGERQVAVKLVKPGMDSRQVLQRFEAERQALAVMEHPSIAHVFDAGISDSGQPYFVMEYVDGVPLGDYVQSERLGVEQRLQLFLQICAGVQHAHRKGVLHRDLKPSNVLVAQHEGEALPKIIDFGLARATEEADPERTMLTRAGQVLGTPEYMSPEQAGFSEEAADTRSDVYSLGVMLYELLTGVLPLGRESLRDLSPSRVERILCEEVPIAPSMQIVQRGPALEGDLRWIPKTVLARRVRGDLDWIVLRALEKEPERRYGSVEAFADDVRRHLRGDPVEAGPPSGIYRARKFVRRYRLLLGFAALLVLSLSAGLLFTLHYYVQALDAEAKARVAQESAELRAAYNEQLVESTRRLYGMRAGIPRHGDFVMTGWEESFEPAQGEQRVDGQAFALHSGAAFKDAQEEEKPGWYDMSDNSDASYVRNGEGGWGLRLRSERKNSHASIAHRIDPETRAYAADFSVSLRVRVLSVFGDRTFGLGLQSVPAWTGHVTSAPRHARSGHHLVQIVMPGNQHLSALDEDERPKGPVLAVGNTGSRYRSLSTHVLDPSAWNELRVRYRLLPGRKVRLEAWLNGAPAGEPVEFEKHDWEDEIRWLTLSSGDGAVLIDRLEVRRELPRGVWLEHSPTGRFYALTPDPVTRSGALAFATRRKGQLARLQDPELLEWILAYFGKHVFHVAESATALADAYPIAGPDELRHGLVEFESRPSQSQFGTLPGDLRSVERIGGRGSDMPTRSWALVTWPDGGYSYSYALRGAGGVAGPMTRAAKALRRVDAGEHADAIVVRCDARGRTQWSQRIVSEGDAEPFDAIALPDGALALLFRASGRWQARPVGADLDVEERGARHVHRCVVLCFDRAGHERWRWESPSDWGATRPTGLAFDSRGGRLYAVGSAAFSGLASAGADAAIPQRNPFVVQLGLDGRERWTRTATGPGPDDIEDVCVLGDSSVVVTGACYKRLELAPGNVLESKATRVLLDAEQFRNIFLVRYDASGSILSQRVLGGEGGAVSAGPFVRPQMVAFSWLRPWTSRSLCSLGGNQRTCWTSSGPWRSGSKPGS